MGTMDYPAQFDKQKWLDLKPVFAARIKQKTRDAWCEIFAGSDACFAPVLDMDEAPSYAHNVVREAFVTVEGVTQSAPAPRFSRTPSEVQHPPVAAGSDNLQVFTDIGLSQQDIDRLRQSGIIA